jgi:membrane-associated phospholipid phosphatase
VIPDRREPFVAWPGWAHLRIAWLQTIVLTAWFALVFGGANWITASRATRVRVHLDAELQIPLIPGFMLFYMSIYGLFLIAPFVLRSRREITMLAMAQALTIFVAGICFLLIPGSLAFAPATDSQLGIWSGIFRVADQWNLDYNLVPSLHVALSVVCVEFFAPHASTGGKILLRTWAVLIAVATVVTHQHHLLDAFTGFLLASAIVWLVRRPHH